MARKAEAWQAERHEGNTRGHLISRWAVGRMLRATKQLRRGAQGPVGSLRPSTRKLDQKDGFVQEETRRASPGQGRASETAQPYFARAYEILKDSWVKSEKKRIANA